MSLVVTGATGQLGRLVLDSLLRRGVAPSEIVAAGRDAEKLAALEPLGVRTARIDYTDPASLEEAFRGADVVLLVSSSAVGERVAQHANAITAAQDVGIGRLVYTSASKAADTTLVLAPEHKATEEAILASGLAYTIVRNGWYTENYADTLAQARATGEIVSSAGDGRVASATRADYADAIAAVLVAPGQENEIYELAGDDAWSFEELAAVFASVLNRDVVYRRVSSDEHRAILLAAGLDEATAGFVVALDSNIRDGELSLVTGDLARLAGRPSTTLVEAVRAMAAE